MRRTAVAAAVALLLLGCGDGGGDDDASGVTTSSSSSSTLTTGRDAVAATTAAIPTTAPAGGATPVFTAPTEADCVDGGAIPLEGTPIDVGGDDPATVDVYTDVDGPFLVLSRPGSVGLTPVAGSEPPRIASVLDLDGDGTDEVWIQSGSGASVLIYDLYHVVDDCRLAPVDLGGAPASFPVGGTVGNQAGVFCTDSGAVVAVVASSDDGELYRGDRTQLRLRGGVLETESSVPFELAAADPSFPELAAFRC